MAGLSSDEYGKHILVTSFPMRDTDDDEEWNKMWRRFRDHESKLGNALLHVWWEDLFDLGDPPSASDFHKKRLRATYVDLSQGGDDVLVPDDVVSESELNRLLEQLGSSIARSEECFGDLSVGRFAEVMTKMSDSAEAAQMRAASDAGPTAVMKQYRRTRLRHVASRALDDPDKVEEIVAALERVMEQADETESSTTHDPEESG